MTSTTDIFPELFEDTALQTLAAQVARRFFEGKPTPPVAWGLPDSTISVRRDSFDIISDQQVAHHFDAAKSMLKEGQWQQAIERLYLPADQGHVLSAFLLSHLLKRHGGDWQHYAQLYASRVRVSRRVPAVQYQRARDHIVIHPYLRHRKVPRYVLVNLLWHAMHDALFPVTEGIQESPAYSYRHSPGDSSEANRRQAPDQQRSDQWLAKEGFPAPQRCAPHIVWQPARKKLA